jgi:hypothetical protein
MDASHATTARTYQLTAVSPGYQAYQALHIGFTIAPLVAGLDKFFYWLTNWDQYLAPTIASMVANVMPVSTFMQAVGVIEILAALLVALKPRIGAYVVCAWLVGIIVNLLLLGGYYDIALRDLGLAIGAFALGRLSQEYST